MKEAHHGAGYAAVPAAVERGQPRGETARDRITRGVERMGLRTRMHTSRQLLPSPTPSTP